MKTLKYALLIIAFFLGTVPAEARNFTIYHDTPLKVCNSKENMGALLMTLEQSNLIAAEVAVRALLARGSCKEIPGIKTIEGATVLGSISPDSGTWGLGYGEILFIELKGCEVYKDCYMAITKNTVFSFYEDAVYAVLASRRSKTILDLFK